MITYGYSLQGKSHIDRNTVCQDSSAAVKLKSGYYLGVVADGVGSAPHSDVGSGIAVESLQAYCEQYVKKGMKDVELEDILRDGYEYAFRQVENLSRSRAVRLRIMIRHYPRYFTMAQR